MEAVARQCCRNAIEAGVLREENEDIVDGFMDEHPEFTGVSCGDILRQQDIEANVGERMRLWPHVHGTDAFFGAVLERAMGPLREGPRAQISF